MSVIDSFLVGIGFDVDEQSEKDAESSISGLSSSFVQAGAAMAASMAAVGLAVKSQASELDTLGKSARALSDSTVEDISRLEYAVGASGGTVEDVIGLLESMEGIRAGARFGDLDFESFAKAGIPIAALVDESETALGLAVKLIDQYGKLDKIQKINAQDVLGLSKAQTLLFKGGTDQLNTLVERANELGVTTASMTQAGENITQAFGDLDTVFQNLKNELVQDFEIPFVNKIEALTDSLIFVRDEVRDIQFTDDDGSISGETFSGFGLLSALAGAGLIGVSAAVPFAAPVTAPLGTSLMYGGLGMATYGAGSSALRDYSNTVPYGDNRDPRGASDVRIDVNAPITINDASDPRATADAVSSGLTKIVRDARSSPRSGSIDR